MWFQMNGEDAISKEEAKEAGGKTEKKTKTVTKTIDLPVTAQVPSLSKQQLTTLLETEVSKCRNRDQ